MRIIILVCITLFLTACATTGGGGSPYSRSKAFVTYDELEEIDQINYQLGESYVNSGNYNVAEEKLMKVVARAPSFPNVYNALGVMSERQGRFSNALTLFYKAVELNPNFDLAMRNFSRLQCRENGPERLLSIASNTQNSTLRAGLYSGLAECQLREQQYDEALVSAGKAVVSDASYGYSYFYRAFALFSKKDYQEALYSLEKFHDLKGYTDEGARLGLSIAQAMNNKTEINKYNEIVRTQF